MSNLKSFVVKFRDGTQETIKAEGCGYDDAGNLAFLKTKKTIATPENPAGGSYAVAFITFSRDVIHSFTSLADVPSEISALEQVA